ncbi:MAG: hypothetical protein GXO54_07490 [Chloroflexi bacterium]|nr:hypothetical protein [Chloroflexota bacterium]
MKTALLELQPYDDRYTLFDRMLWARAPRILLVWPEKGPQPAMRGPLDLVLLQRHAARLGAQIAVVTQDARIVRWAQFAGVPVFPDIDTAHRQPWRRPRRRSTRIRRRTHVRRARPALIRSNAALHEQAWPRVLALGLAVLAWFALAIYLGPAAHVEVQSPVYTYRARWDMQASPAFPHVLAYGVPLRRVTVQIQAQASVPTHGVMSLPARTARGEVVLTNLTDQPLTLPAGLVIRSRTDPDWTFVLPRAITLEPGPGTRARGLIEALRPGAAGNRPPGDVAVVPPPWDVRVAVTNPKPLSGGEDARVARPTEADYQRAREAALAKLEARLGEQLEDQGWLWTWEGVQPRELTVNFTPSPSDRGPATQVTARAQARYEVWVVAVEDVAQWVQAQLARSRPRGLAGVPGSPRWQVEPIPGRSPWHWRVTASEQRYVQPDGRALARTVRGWPWPRVQTYIQATWPGAVVQTVQPWPSWWPWAPWWEVRLTWDWIPQAPAANLDREK